MIALPQIAAITTFSAFGIRMIPEGEAVGLFGGISISSIEKEALRYNLISVTSQIV